MRSAIGLVATVATVFHLAFGCCLHAAHLGGPACCRVDERPDGHADGCCDDHGHDHARPDGHAAPDVTPAAVGHAGAECLCAGCTCTAIGVAKEIPPDVARPAAVAWTGAAGDGAGTAGVAPASPTGHRCPIPTDPRSALFERLLA